MAAEVSNINIIGTIDRCMLEPGHGILNNARLWVNTSRKVKGTEAEGTQKMNWLVYHWECDLWQMGMINQLGVDSGDYRSL